MKIGSIVKIKDDICGDSSVEGTYINNDMALLAGKLAATTGDHEDRTFSLDIDGNKWSWPEGVLIDTGETLTASERYSVGDEVTLRIDSGGRRVQIMQSAHPTYGVGDAEGRQFSVQNKCIIGRWNNVVSVKWPEEKNISISF